ncbi:serine acetyltransferase [Pseudomonas sp. RIT-PI-AD]|uniref:serine acetyltransferase n=1 Tax=Pseudomonas sp. RIT-PI-AD TaxID=3035294 RepID=UPI0021DAB793|nr:serine acetyltransferase [Pseudomonas sp. RIT-PI-AD]
MTFAQLKRYWHIELIGGEHKRFTWKRLWRKYRQRARYRYLFWYRLSLFLFARGGFWRSRARRLNDRLGERYGIEIPLEAQIGEGLFIPHPVGIVITRKAIIGRNFSVFQNTTIGQKHDDSGPIVIGDNVSVGANSCIIGDNLRIGDDVAIAAASFVNKDIPAGHIHISRHVSTLVENTRGHPPISTRNQRQS